MKWRGIATFILLSPPVTVSAADLVLSCEIKVTQADPQSTVQRKLAFYFASAQGVEYEDRGKGFDELRHFTFEADDEFIRLHDITLVLSKDEIGTNHFRERTVRYTDTVIDRGSGEYVGHYHYTTTTYEQEYSQGTCRKVGEGEVCVSAPSSRHILSTDEGAAITARGMCERAPDRERKF